LEFPVVFIVGCEDGVLPLRWGGGGETDADADEERRLFFVGMTRAQDRLFLSHARRRLWRGTVRDMERSAFLRDIEERLLERQKSDGKRRRPRDSRVQMELF
jgi:DNA helicase-2/ATP-dependent DNA helicase PcrA